MKFNISKFMMGLLLIIAFFAILLLSSCEPGVGPKLTSECDYSTPITLNVVEHETEASLKDDYENILPWMKIENYTIGGFATKNLVTNTHTLHILKIRGQEDHERIEVLGHELMHSFCGEWHPVVFDKG